MAAKKAKKKYHRKNPKRVAAGKKAARARWGKGTKKSSKKASKKSGKKRKVGLSRIENAVEKIMSRNYTIALDGSRHSVSFPGHSKGGTKKAGKKKSRKPASPAQLLARARFTAMVKARAAARRSGGVRALKVRVPKFKHGTEPRFVPYGFTGE